MGAFLYNHFMKAGIVAVFSKRRERYLPIYLEKIKKYLERTSLDYEIIVAEQLDYDTTFNFSLCANVGIRCAFEKLQCDYAVLVGPDNIPVENVDYSWLGQNETSFLMYGGYKIDFNSFYRSNGNNIFMGWGAMWMDVEFYDRLRFYRVPFVEWYVTPEAINSKIIDLSKSNISTEDVSLRIWEQGRPDLTLNDVPTIIPVDSVESDITFAPYQENYWYSDIIKEAHVNLTDLLRHTTPEAKDSYYRNSGYRRINMNAVNHLSEEQVHYFKYNTLDALSPLKDHNEVIFPISRRVLENSDGLLEKEYDLIDNKIIRRDFI